MGAERATPSRLSEISTPGTADAILCGGGDSSGVWEFFLPGAKAGDRYKYEIVDRQGTRLPWKADPVASATELPPRTASIVPSAKAHMWRDDEWMKTRGSRQNASAPLSIYEVHVGSWLRRDDGDTIKWAELAERLIPYAQKLNFTHNRTSADCRASLRWIMGLSTARFVRAIEPLRQAGRV